MKKPGNKRTLELASCLAVVLHLALFFFVRPAPGIGLAGSRVPPKTHYLAKAPGALPVDGADARVIWSPLLFALPSEMGFSRNLLQERPRTPTGESPQAELESFLAVDIASRSAGTPFDPQDLMVTAFDPAAPSLPANGLGPVSRRPAARRVYVAPELKERLEGGIVLPPALNKEVETAWEVRAAVSISEQGAVRHVFLDQPLESAKLNNQVLRLLYGLHFKPGKEPVEGHIEIYSPETLRDKEVTP